MTTLAIRGLRKSFGEQVVLGGLDLDVADGAITAVLGPSGCGKTTLLRLVAGFERPDGGQIVLRGETVASADRDVPPELRHVGVVPQEGALFPHIDVGHNVGFGLAPGRDAARRVAQCLELVGLAGHERARPSELSGGQQQRVALARALAPRPSLVVLDEPFTALDAGLRTQVRDDVAAAIRADGATAVLVTHDQQEALSVADEVAVLLDGRIAQVGPPSTIYRQPASLKVAAFVGEAVILSARLKGGIARCALGELTVGNDPRSATGKVSLVIRPEQITVMAAGTPVEATVLARSYYGHDGMLRLVLTNGTVVTARVGPATLPTVGARVGVAVVGPVMAFA